MNSRKFAKKIPKKGIPLLGFIADSSLSVIVMSGIAHPTGGANRQMGRAKRQQEGGGATQQTAGGATQQTGRLLVSIAVTAVAFGFILLHLIWPGLEIDAIALAFAGIAIVPWLGPLLESIEFPGGFKATFREVEARIQEVQQTTQDVKETAQEALSQTQDVKETAQAALTETQAVKETAQEALSQTQDVKEAAQAALTETQAVKETAQAALTETQAVKETAQAALTRTEEINKKVSNGSLN
jgi:methyl-accepting chemotaxis protein